MTYDPGYDDLPLHLYGYILLVIFVTLILHYLDATSVDILGC